MISGSCTAADAADRSRPLRESACAHTTRHAAQVTANDAGLQRKLITSTTASSMAMAAPAPGELASWRRLLLTLMKVREKGVIHVANLRLIDRDSADFSCGLHAARRKSRE